MYPDRGTKHTQGQRKHTHTHTTKKIVIEFVWKVIVAFFCIFLCGFDISADRFYTIQSKYWHQNNKLKYNRNNEITWITAMIAYVYYLFINKNAAIR